MIKALSAVAVAAFIAAALTILPGFAPQVSASTPVPLAKGDRYHINSFALYEYEGDLYTNIRAAVFRREFHRLKPA